MNKSFENRFSMVYTNENGSKLSSRQKMRFAMRRFRALGLNEEEPHRYENYARIGNRNISVDNALDNLAKAIEDVRAEIVAFKGVHTGTSFQLMSNMNYIETQIAFMLPDQKERFSRLKRQVDSLPKFIDEVHKKAFGF